MPDAISVTVGENRDTQLYTIRDLMLSAARRGAWLTLGEIARLTEIGEASISAQLRHLRKRRHGRHRVEKRLRRNRPKTGGVARGERGAGKRRTAGVATMWEYRVLPAAGRERPARSREGQAQRVSPDAERAGNIPGFVQASEMEAACGDEHGRVETESCRHFAGSVAQDATEGSDAEARN